MVNLYTEFMEYVSENNTKFEEICERGIELVENNGKKSLKSLGLNSNFIINVYNNKIVYYIYEQIVIASIFIGNDENIKVNKIKNGKMRKKYLEKLMNKFPESEKVYILLGMSLERAGRLKI